VSIIDGEQREVACGCDEPHLTAELRRQLAKMLDSEMEYLTVMQARGWPLATPPEFIPAAFGGSRQATP
jgi:hypothetical protein